MGAAVSFEEASALVATEGRLLSAAAMRVPLHGLRAAPSAGAAAVATASAAVAASATAPPPVATPPSGGAASAPATGDAAPATSLEADKLGSLVPSQVVAPLPPPIGQRPPSALLRCSPPALPTRGPSGDWAADAAEALLAKKVDPFGEEEEEEICGEDTALLEGCAARSGFPDELSV
mmetsp:Transcript_114973/g.298039  ORF Transcript_114973/g.298039 Transcript_114973/m.298039 type:complete len:178 (+) Transcript_114973:1112-1645(+)